MDTLSFRLSVRQEEGREGGGGDHEEELSPDATVAWMT